MNAIGFYRAARWCYQHHVPLAPKLLQGMIFVLFNSFVPYTAEIGEGSKIAHKTADVLTGVVNAIQQIAETSKTLSENSQVQADSVEQADLGIARISEIVQSNSAAAEESFATSEELSAQAMTMHELVAQFQLKSE